MQDQIYADLLSSLDLKLTNEELAKSTIHVTENLSAYELYLKGQSVLHNGQRDEKTLKQALEYFEAATQKDRNFAKAYTGMADTGVFLYNIKKEDSSIGCGDPRQSHQQQSSRGSLFARPSL
jgi:hypothetical protein